MFKKWLVFISLCVLSSAAWAEQEKVFDDHIVSFSALNTTFITPEVSKQYAISRSEKRGLLTLAVHAKPNVPVPASITASARSLLGANEQIEMRRVEEGTAVYYIGTFPMTNRDTLTFDIDVKPEDSTENYSFKFSQQFFK